MSGAWEAVQGNVARQREIAQAVPRASRVRFIVNVTGVGETRLPFVGFGAFMLDEPTFSFGVIARTPLTVGQLPLATATVTKWRRNSRGMYVGAEVGFRIESIEMNTRLKFSLTFEATALRTTAGLGDRPDGGD